MYSKISVTGGKGGTGKSTVAVNLAVSLAMMGRDVVLADLDVEAPNDYILLSAELGGEEPVKIMLPFIDYGKCIKCGVCAKVCDTGAIIVTKGGAPFVFPRLCSGCRSCYFACPVNAIVEGGRVLGYTYEGRVRVGEASLTLVTGVLREGEEHTSPVVLACRERAEAVARDLLVVDTSAGSSNNVSVAIEDSDLVVAVTEPTPLGLHDLKLILELTGRMGLRTWVVVNRAGIGSEEGVAEVAKSFNVEVVARIPYSRDIVETYVKGVPIVSSMPSHPISKVFKGLALRVTEVVGSGS